MVISYSLDVQYSIRDSYVCRCYANGAAAQCLPADCKTNEVFTQVQCIFILKQCVLWETLEDNNNFVAVVNLNCDFVTMCV